MYMTGDLCTDLLRCLKRKTAVLKLTGGREYRRVIIHCSLASGSERPVCVCVCVIVGLKTYNTQRMHVCDGGGGGGYTYMYVTTHKVILISRNTTGCT